MGKKQIYLIVSALIIIALGVATYYVFIKPKSNMTNPLISGTVNNPTLEITDLVVGSGLEAKSGNTVTVNYTGTLTNGKKFDSSYDRNQPFKFVIGNGDVISGWDQGLLGMRVGGKRKLVIPPEMGYGNQNIGDGLIPANSTLIFEVELLEVK